VENQKVVVPPLQQVDREEVTAARHTAPAVIRQVPSPLIQIPA